MSDRPRAIPIHLSLIRPILLMGAERELVLISGILAAVLVSAIFLLSMRRIRALVGVGIPLLIGTTWTGALAAVALRGLNAVTVAFSAIVLGVGLDTGVHLYDRVLRERREGYPANVAATRALRALTAPLLTAAATAAFKPPSTAFVFGPSITRAGAALTGRSTRAW